MTLNLMLSDPHNRVNSLDLILMTLLRSLIFNTLHRSSSHRCGFEPSLGHVRQAKFCLRVVKCFFSGISRVRPTLRFIRLKMREIILRGCKTQMKKKKKKCHSSYSGEGWENTIKSVTSAGIKFELLSSVARTSVSKMSICTWFLNLILTNHVF